MAQSGAIWVDKMCYGIGQVDYCGTFTVNANVTTVTHGKGFTVAWNAAGYFLVTLNTSFKAMIDAGATLNASNVTGNTLSHPGFCVCGDLTNNNVFAIYTYSFAGSQANPASNVLIEFAVTVSNSLTNA